MKKLQILICVILGSLFARSQPLEELVQDVQAHKTSMTQLRALFSKHPSYEDASEFGYNFAMLGQRTDKAEFHYTLADSITRRMTVETTYKKDQVGYIKIKGQYYDKTAGTFIWQTAYTYVDTPFTNQMLEAYNKIHQTQFTWKDLYEDSCKGFFINMSGSDFADSAFDAEGNFKDRIILSRPMKLEFYPLIKRRDHNAIIKNCLSFNPARKAYGAVCLYALQQLGEPLSKTEKHLLRKCRRCREKVLYDASTDLIDLVKVRALLGSNKHMREECRWLLLPNQPKTQTSEQLHHSTHVR
ncbi:MULTISPECIES: hypothetical protein [Niastella]|uniref:Uncharacterized protein n=1 Tax=Niastella soli TaxID=2821487 RepID=A0ABS3Z350_9BACT|nr:hypothetical protein [Niastella soli]MBO9204589.1 hypothetical protein [Niastella soli]